MNSAALATLTNHLRNLSRAFDAAFKATNDYAFIEQKRGLLHYWNFIECECCGNIEDEFRDEDGKHVCLKCKDAELDKKLEWQIR